MSAVIRALWRMLSWPGWRAKITDLDTRHRSTGASALVLVAFLVFALIGFGYGPIRTPDGRFLHELALSFAEMNFDVDRFVERYPGLTRVYRPETYLLYFYQLAIFERLSGGNWIGAHILVNAVAQTATTAFAMQIAARTYQNFTAVAVVFVLSLTCWEFLQWVAQTQSDTVFAFLAAAQFSLILFGWTARSRRHGLAFVAAALVLGIAAVFYRPTGPALAALGFLAFGVGWIVCGRPEACRANSSRLLIVGLAGAVVAAIFLGAAVLYDPHLIPGGGLARKFMELHELAARGVVINHRPETFLSPRETYAHYFVLVLVRMAYYFWFVGDGFSFLHRVLNIGFFVPLYALALIGVLRSTWSSPRIATRVRVLTFLSISFVVVFGVFHAVSLIDFDWRYRAPVYIPLFFLALTGAISTRSWFQRVRIGRFGRRDWTKYQ